MGREGKEIRSKGEDVLGGGGWLASGSWEHGEMENPNDYDDDDDSGSHDGDGTGDAGCSRASTMTTAATAPRVSPRIVRIN